MSLKLDPVLYYLVPERKPYNLFYINRLRVFLKTKIFDYHKITPYFLLKIGSILKFLKIFVFKLAHKVLIFKLL